MKRFIVLFAVIILTGCQMSPDGWHYNCFNQNTSPEYIKGNYIISCNYKHFVLFKDGEKVNDFKDLAHAKQFVENSH